MKILQSDGGTESKVLTNNFKEKRIIHRITCPYTSEQNGLVERKHWHIVESGLSLLAHANLPLKF